MTAEELLNEGKLTEAYEQLKKQVQANPANSKLRIFLFQLLVVMGEWQRALTQLTVAGKMDASSLAMVQTYRELIRCEVFREDVFKGKRKPLVFGDPDEWIVLLIEALSETVSEEQAAELRQKAFELASTVSGVIDNDKFTWLADADSRIGPVLEVILNGHYYWVPFSHIKRIDIEEPTDLRDMVWIPAHFMWTNEGETIGFIPTRYVNTHLEEQAELKFSRKTVWQEEHESVFLGKGQRLLATDNNDYSLLNVRKIIFDDKDSLSGS